MFMLSVDPGFLNLRAEETAPVQAQGAALPTVVEDYILGIEDVLSIVVWKEPDLTLRELIVRPDGKISMPLAGEMQAAGLTPKQLQNAIAEGLKDYVKQPNITVTVVKSLSRNVSVVGQVTRPGSYPIIGPATVLEIIARAGGLTEMAKTKNINVSRKEDGITKKYPFNYKDAIKGINFEQNIILKPRDVVLVP
jgi:polysaccharide biosynthesis/export protein